MNGSKIGKATAEQLKHGNYRNKIAECIQKSILTNRAKAVIRNDGHYALTINLSIGRSGALHHLSIKESCGVPTLDLFILKTVQDASSSFPPVPASLGSDIYPMPIFFENIIAIIQHPEQLRWTL
jgi:outer membrane biosynthesis protein TonB